MPHRWAIRTGWEWLRCHGRFWSYRRVLDFTSSASSSNIQSIVSQGHRGRNDRWQGRVFTSWTFFRFKARIKVKDVDCEMAIDSRYDANLALTSGIITLVWKPMERFFCVSYWRKSSGFLLLFFVVFVSTVVIFQDNEYQPRIAAIGSFQTNTSVLAETNRPK